MMTKTEAEVQAVVAHFVEQVRANGKDAGFREETLTAPVRQLLDGVSELVSSGRVVVADKVSLTVDGLGTGYPDLSIYKEGNLCFVVELKAPGKGADPTLFTGREKDQWFKYSRLPNVIYTDGNDWTLWRDGSLTAEFSVCDDIKSAASPVKDCASEATRLLSDAFSGTPQSIKSTSRLATETAKRCRAIRADVSGLDESLLKGLTQDWRDVLFPDLDDDGFVDAYTQTAAFALLAASSIGIDLSLDVDPSRYDRFGLLLHHVSERLGSERGVLGKALSLLTSDVSVRSEVNASLESMLAVAKAVDWDAIRESVPGDAWMDFYELFLGEYNPALKKLSGSYYTPKPVVEWMVEFTDRILVDLFGLPDGYADHNVTVVDPALGTGTYLLSILNRIGSSAVSRVGAGYAAEAMNEALTERMVGFEIQACPYAVAQLRLIESVRAHDPDLTDIAPGVYLTDTLANPYLEPAPQFFMKAITDQREQADKIKREIPVKVVIGNPPYLAGTAQTSWVSQKLLDEWQPDADWGISAHAKNLSNLYVYFWRWATWKVFENAPKPKTDPGETDQAEQAGIVSFIAPTGWLDGDGFQQMRRWLREWCSHIWVLELSPEGHQASAGSQVFEAMRQPVAIVTAVRLPQKTGQVVVRHHRVPQGTRDSKFDHIADLIALNGDNWTLIEPGLGGRGPMTPPASNRWQQMLSVEDLLPWHGSGVKIGRTWPVAPDQDILQRRWATLLEQRPNKTEMSRYLDEHPRDRTIGTKLTDNLTAQRRRRPQLTDQDLCEATLVEYGYRSFDEQWIIRDKRLIDRPNPSLWAAHSDHQMYLAVPALGTASTRPLIADADGQLVSFSAMIPDMDYLAGSRAGRIHPLWRDQTRTNNTDPATINYLTGVFGRPVSSLDLFAYIAAVVAHPGFTDTFRDDLLNAKVIRVPLTKNPDLFREAADLGRRILYLSTFGKRCGTNPTEPLKAPNGPTLDAVMPTEAHSITHNEATSTLTIHGPAGSRKGAIRNVSTEVYNYNTANMNVIQSWFGYRKHEPAGKKTSPLDEIHPTAWSATYSTDLINLLDVLTLLVAERPAQKKLLDNILNQPLITRNDLETHNAAPTQTGTHAKPPEFQKHNTPELTTTEETNPTTP